MEDTVDTDGKSNYDARSLKLVENTNKSAVACRRELNLRPKAMCIGSNPAELLVDWLLNGPSSHKVISARINSVGRSQFKVLADE